jgi:hypothetical protein
MREPEAEGGEGLNGWLANHVFCVVGMDDAALSVITAACDFRAIPVPFTGWIQAPNTGLWRQSSCPMRASTHVGGGHIRP